MRRNELPTYFRYAACLALAGFFLPLPLAQAQPTPGDIPVTAVVSTGLAGPVGIFNANDLSNRLFVIQQGGVARVLVNEALQGTAYFTLSNAATQCAETEGGALANTGFVSGGERGLLGLAFHPQFTSNGRLFVSFSGIDGDTIVARYTVADPQASALSAGDLASCVVILRVDQDFGNHNGGNIVFGPDGFLYFGLGDGGDANDNCNRAQTLNPANLNNAGSCASDAIFTDPDGNSVPDRPTTTRALLGKMLRLDVDNTTPAGANGLCGARLDGAANYAIPASNPFAGADPQGGCDEVWHYGLRNPWRFSFDRLTGDLFIGDVGQAHWEEIDLLPAGNTGGSNFAWRLCEGNHVRGSCPNLCAQPGVVAPIIEYRNGNANCSSPTTAGFAVTGGYRYRGPDANLQGVYFYGDAGASGLRFSVDQGGSGWVQPTAASIVTAGISGVTVAFGEDPGGTLYFLGGNTLYRIGGRAVLDVLFASGFE